MGSVTSWIVIVGTLGSILFAYLVLRLNRTLPRPGETTGHSWDEIQEFDNPLPRWWYWMFLLSLLWGVGYLVWYPGLGNFAGVGEWSSDEEVAADLAAMEAQYAPIYASYADTSVAALAQDADAIRMGQRLFAISCAPCHGSAGAGGPGYPDLTDEAWKWGGTGEAIEQTILNGRVGIMPAWEGVIPEDAIDEIVTYVLSLSTDGQSAEAAERGRTTYMLYCVACHGADGKGNPLLGSADLTDRVWLYGGTRETIAATVRGGRNGEMPAFGSKLGEDRVHILAAYVYSLSN